MDSADTFASLGIAMGLGLLVGLQREHTGSGPAGIRSFPLVALFGAACALLAKPAGGVVLAAGALATGALVVVLSLLRRRETGGFGVTSGLALLTLFVVGALAVLGPWDVAVALGGTVYVLLQEKTRLHAFARRFGEKDGRAVAQLTLVALVLLPILPDRDLGPYDVWNPRHLGLLVALVSALSLLAYLVQKLAGARLGVAATGLLGGMVSSTATTVSIARRARHGLPPRLAALVVVLASTVVVGRQAVEITAVASDQLESFLPALGLAFVGLLPATIYGIWSLTRADVSTLPESDNPADLGTALVFTLVFAAVLVAVAFAADRLGDAGVYAVAAVSGLTDVDAITMSTARLCAQGQVGPGVAWRAVLLAFVANLAFKALIAGVLGGRRVGVVAGLCFVPVAVVGAIGWVLLPA